MTNSTSVREWRNGWPLILSASFGISVVPLIIYTSGVFMKPLQAEFGWSRTELTSGLLITSLVGVISAPLVGILIDRFGPRRIALPGIVLYCCALAAFSTLTASLTHWWLLWLGIALAMPLLAPTVWASAVASRFDHSRGLALALTLSGTGLTGIVAPALCGYLLEQYGWRTAFVALAAIWGVVCLPIVAAFFFGATDLARSKSSRSSPVPQPVLNGMRGREVLGRTKFYRLALAVLLVMLVLSGLLVHVVPVFIDAGMNASSAASAASIVGLTTIIGRLSAGFLLDRIDGRWVGSAFFALPVLLMLTLLSYDGTLAMALLIAALLGLCTGAEFDVAAYLTSRYFGMKNYGLLFGIIAGTMSLAMGVGPALYGAVYDHFGTYEPAFYSAIVGSLAAAMLLATLGPSEASFASQKNA